MRNRSALLVFCCLVSGVVHANYRKPFNPPYSSELDREGKVVFRWNFTSKVIKFEVSMLTLGWVGIGFSPSGTMKEADIIFAFMKNGTAHILDMHAPANGPPKLDARQNFRYRYMKQNGTHTTLYINRFLDTCDDAHDFAITEDTTRVIYAYGNEVPNGDVPTSDNYHGANRGVKSLRLLDRKLPAVDSKKDKDMKSFEIRTRPFLVPKRDTYYHCFYAKMPEFDEKHHIVQFEAALTPGNERYIHHITMFHCNDSLVSDEMLHMGEECYVNDLEGGHWDICSPVIVAWAVGMTEFALPEHVGFPLGVPGAPKIVKMEIHYDNENLKDDITDSSGFRIHYTKKLRQYDAGILLVGHDVWPTLFVPQGSRDFITQGHCTQQCLEKIFDTGNMTYINTFAAFLHSHTAGHRMILRHYRNGSELEPLARDLAYDFDYQETKLLRKEKTIHYGDNLIMECVYDTTKRKVPTLGGLGTRDEMCFGFLMYYPKMEDAYCQSAPRATTLLDEMGANDMAGAYYNAMIKNWTEDEIHAFNIKQLRSPLWELCLTLHGPLEIAKPGSVPAIKSNFVEQPGRCEMRKVKRKERKLHDLTKRSHGMTPENESLKETDIKSGTDVTYLIVSMGTISMIVIGTLVGLIYYTRR